MNDVHGLRFDAGSLSLNLVATLGRRFGEPVERLGSAERLRAWLDGVGIDPAADPSDADLVRVCALREHLDDLFRAELEGGRPPAPAVAAVDAAAAACPARLGAPASVDSVLGLAAADAIRILSTGERRALHACDADDCRMVYLAHGRRARRWCSSERCGNRSRVAAHRARAAAA